NQVELYQHTPFHAGIRSAIVPGWGQGFNMQPVKGSLVFTSFVATTWLALYSTHKYRQSYDDYNAKGVKDDGLYNAYESERTEAYVLGSVAVLIWAFSIVDAAKNAYRPLLAKETSIQIAANDKEGKIVWNRRF